MKNKSVKFKITASAIACFVIGMLVILVVLFFYLRSAFQTSNNEMFMEMGESYAYMIMDTFENPVSFLTGICSIAEAQIKTGNTDREALQQYIFRAFDKYKLSEGTAFMMEPNVYDGKDDEYVNSDFGTPLSGRISYYYFQENGVTNYLPQTEDDDQEFVQPYYLTSKERKVPTYSEPYLYEFDGKSVSMITASYPMMDDSGNVLGIATVDLYLDSISEKLSQVTIFNTGYMVVVSESGSILYCPDPNLVGEDAKSAGLLYEQPSSGETVRISEVESFVNGKPAVAATVPLKLNLADSSFYVSVVAPQSEANAVINRLIIIMVVIFVAVGFAIVIVVSVSTGRIVNPLIPITKFMERAGNRGDITLTQVDADLIARSSSQNDEIGKLISSSAEFVKHISEVSSKLEAVADGDLSTDHIPLSENDGLGNSLHKMINNLNNMFGEIHSSTARVSEGSRNIAHGSQALAQGSTEQAASVEELSTSIADIAQKTKENAQMAERAAGLASTIMHNAERGSQQMDEMTSAVREINQASQNIGKVIKVIDDIAFQTNILALNAAVEAARAGQHGKGFAVVAEEVRNLAAKSAEAAKDTEGLIANSMEKAELGARIAEGTAASLTEIVSGINESNQIVGEIYRASEEQSTEIVQINNGINQVAQVTQQNSATAEESAASSEEMSDQSKILAALISQLKLKGREKGRIAQQAPAAAQQPLSLPDSAGFGFDEGFGKY